jgi:polysaccharide biosynthesis protein PslG
MSLLGLLKSLFAPSNAPTASPRPLPVERTAVLRGLDPSPFGVNAHVAAPAMMQTLASGGLRWFRVDVDWDRVEAVEGQPAWEALDAAIDELRGHGVALLGSLAYTPAWASGADPDAPPEKRRGLMPRDPGRYLAFVDAVGARYGGAFHALSIWNEPNQEIYFRGTRTEYLEQILRAGLERLRDRAPHIVRCGPDLSSSPPKQPLEWLGAALDVAGDLLDVVTHHQYDGGERVDRRAEAIADVRRLIDRKGFADRPLWITETGWRRPQVSAAQQADRLAEMLAGMASRRTWSKTFWFDSHGPGEGLLGPDDTPEFNQPFPVFDRFAQVIAQGGYGPRHA